MRRIVGARRYRGSFGCGKRPRQRRCRAHSDCHSQCANARESIRSSARASGWKPRKPRRRSRLFACKVGLGIALADRSLQAEHGLDESVPRRTAEPRLDRKHRQFAGFPAIAAHGLALVRTGWLSSCGSQFKLTAQARLVVLDLGEQMIARGDHALERFFGRVRRRA